MKDFMKFLTVIFASLFCFHLACSTNKNGMEPPPAQDKPADTINSGIRSWITTGDESKLLSRQASVPFFAGSAIAEVNITIDTTQQFQSMDGFGYTLTGGSATLINNMPAEAKNKLLHELFDNSGDAVALNFLRVSIGASDLSATVFTYDDMPAGQTDPDLQNFSLEKDKTDLIPLLKEILKINPQIKILATPWTPPLWMKDNGSSVGGSLLPEYFDVYARYFVKYIQEMKEEGVGIYAITPQNEPLHPGNNPSMLMTAEQQRDFIKNSLGPAFRDAGLTTKIIVYDHNCDRPDYPLTILNDPEAKQYVDGSAFHLYAGDINAMSQVRSAHPDRNIYFTEQYTGVDGNFGGDLGWHLKNLIIGAPRNWSKTVLEWNLANDINYGPHTPGGCTTCKGALTINGTAVKRNVAYYIIAHASRFVPPGSIRVGSAIANNLHNVAFVTPNGEVVVIAYNDGESLLNFSIKIGDQSGKVSLPAKAAGTFVVRY